MRKRLIATAKPAAEESESWLDLERLATAEVTSEDPALPIEAALLSSGEGGWRAAEPGAQRVRIVFDEPQSIRRVWLRFVEPDAERTQEFVLRWSADGGQSYREIARQQWNFSPRGATCEVEDYRVDLSGVSAVELAIVPDIAGGDARASLEQWRLA